MIVSRLEFCPRRAEEHRISMDTALFLKTTVPFHSEYSCLDHQEKSVKVFRCLRGSQYKDEKY